MRGAACSAARSGIASFAARENARLGLTTAEAGSIGVSQPGGADGVGAAASGANTNKSATPQEGSREKSNMTFTEAAAEVLRLAGKPLHYKEITELAVEKNLLSHVGKSPEVTMGARLAALIKKEDKSIPIVRVRPGVFALREWEDGKPRKAKEAAEEDAMTTDEESTDVNALEVGELEQRAEQEGEPEEDEEEIPESPEDALRADLAASGADLFDDEEDDDQPILAPTATEPGTPAQPGEGGRRRRRRRRRRGGGGGDRSSVDLGMPSAMTDGTEGPVEARDPLAPAPRPMIRDRQQIMASTGPIAEVQLAEGEELAGKDLADAALVVLAAFDRNAGPVSIRSIVDALAKRGRIGGDPVIASGQLSAALRGDNLRRMANGQRPRFRFSNGARVAPTEWLLGGDLVRLEQDAQFAVDRYREAARRTLLRKIQELPGHAFVELALLALDRVGMTQLRVVKRPGSPGGEAHFAAVHKTGSDEIRTAIVIRKDGRELGRERVSDLRGALHHYGPATAGWLITTGQVLSGAREEAAAQNASPIALYDGLAFCKLLEDYEIGVVRTRMTIALPDLELLEALRSG